MKNMSSKQRAVIGLGDIRKCFGIAREVRPILSAQEACGLEANFNPTQARCTAYASSTVMFEY